MNQNLNYRAKPYEVEAVQYDGTWESIKHFAQQSYAFPGSVNEDGSIHLATRSNSRARAKPSDWIVRYKFPRTQFEVYDKYEFQALFEKRG